LHLVDSALAALHQSGKSIRVGLVGAGHFGRAVALQLYTVNPAIRLVAIANRTLENAARAFHHAGCTEPVTVDDVSRLERCINNGQAAITTDPILLATCDCVDVLVDVTGSIEYSARVVLKAIENGKHIVLGNAELDGTIGPLLHDRAKRAGVIYTNCDGDQPGVIMNLYRFVRGIGLNPRLCGNIKGLQDPYRNPDTQAGYAREHGQRAHMVTSFADGSKISFEQAVVANATGMSVGQRGMFGPSVAEGTRLEDVIEFYPKQALLTGNGIVDYVVGAYPAPGVFVIATCEDTRQQPYLKQYKMGDGPFYLLYTPYHLCHFEMGNSIARASLFADSVIAPTQGHLVDVIAVAKKDLKAGQVIDGIGYYSVYGQCENTTTCREENLLPLGVAEGCVLLRDIPRDSALSYRDVRLPENRLIDKLRDEQTRKLALPRMHNQA